MFSFSKHPLHRLFQSNIPSFSSDEVKSLNEIDLGSVALKTSKPFVSICEKHLFAKESALLSQLNHDNFVKVLADCERPASIMLELCEFSLKLLQANE